MVLWPASLKGAQQGRIWIFSLFELSMFQGGLFVRACSCLKDSFREKKSIGLINSLIHTLRLLLYRNMSDPVVVFVGFWPSFDCCHTGVVGQQRVPGQGWLWGGAVRRGWDMTCCCCRRRLLRILTLPRQSPGLTCSFHWEGNSTNHRISVPQHHWNVFWAKAGAHVASCVRLGQWINGETCASGEDKVKYWVGKGKTNVSGSCLALQRVQIGTIPLILFSYPRYLHFLSLWGLWAAWNPWLRAGLRVPGWTAENPWSGTDSLCQEWEGKEWEWESSSKLPLPRKPEQVFVE